MIEITLREYLKEIENLLEANQAEAAGRHCQQILQFFPKDLAAYRLAGQAYLESGQVQKAADIFLRLLSSIPDDFTAHLGLAVIREGESQVEAALWHLERAYEIKPASQALAGEVARLSAKLKESIQQGASLSRPALGRMYLKGGCFEQALAELQLAVDENPSRPDLFILLAEAQEQAGQADLAAETCQLALQKLPYSMQANRILFQIAMQASDQAQASAYRQRLQELDPYWAFVTPGALDPALAPDHAVSLERLNDTKI